MPKTEGRTWSDWITDRAMRIVIGTALLMPYRTRVKFMGWFMQRCIAPLAGYNARSKRNLYFIYPDMSSIERKLIAGQVANNAGRTFIENYSTQEFLTRNREADISGDGVRALHLAREQGRAVILASGHYGNYEAARAALVSRGFNIGGLYRAARNKYFNDHYEQTMKAFGGPVFAQGRRGTSGFVRHLKAGGMLVLLFDQHVQEGKDLPFLGHLARTAVSASELALRYNALLIPFYGIRKPNGLDFDIQFEAPIEHSDAETMTRELNESLERRIEHAPGQWFWVHRRWKTGRKKR